MITITNNQGGEKAKLTVSRGAYETFYKRLGYSIVEDKKVEVSKPVCLLISAANVSPYSSRCHSQT